jgi:hypothetical protein
MIDRMPVRNSDPETSHESAAQVGELAARLRGRIIALARDAGEVGITINEAERLIADHKYNGVSPRFAELVRRGDLVRELIGHGKPTKRFPDGVPHYTARWDERTERNVIVHWSPEFAPKAPAAPAQLPLWQAKKPAQSVKIGK